MQVQKLKRMGNSYNKMVFPVSHCRNSTISPAASRAGRVSCSLFIEPMVSAKQNYPGARSLSFVIISVSGVKKLKKLLAFLNSVCYYR